MTRLSARAATSEAVLSLGSNQGDRVANLEVALRDIERKGVHVQRVSRLYDTEPMHYHEQPRFLNACALVETEKDPYTLLRVAKEQESQQGRQSSGQRYGPRPVDIDITLFGDAEFTTESLTIPHPRMRERMFVLRPLADLLDATGESNPRSESWQTQEGNMRSWWKRMLEQHLHERNTEIFRGNEREGVVPVLPAGDRMITLTNDTLVMGIVNATPDSFSDGGELAASEATGALAANLAEEGAAIVDVGAESTRPGADPVSEEEELSRLLPALRECRNALPNGTLISVDTYKSEVARRAIREGGAHIINDVSGGSLDAAIWRVAAGEGALYCAGHMRGDPRTMQSFANYNNVCHEVGAELAGTALGAWRDGGLPPWRLIVDPGLGFSKDAKHNWELIRGLNHVRTAFHSNLPGVRPPLLVGPSRKGFLGRAMARSTPPADRDFATCAAIAGCVHGGAWAVRSHNARAAWDAARVADTLWRH